MTRLDGRKPHQLRKVRVTKDYNKHAEGSCLIEFGATKVICTASVEESVPPFLRNSGKGWVTAEYGMLPRSTDTRMQREKIATGGRTLEISRLIGRSLRSVVDTSRMGERTIKVDCDVIQADGGTRTAAITGGFIALALALQKLHKRQIFKDIPLYDYVAAVSVGIFEKEMMVDLCYEEDSKAELDMNVVMVGKGKFVEVQGTAEGQPFTRGQMDKLLDLAKTGIEDLIGLQKQALGDMELL